VARARSIKPDFFTDADLTELSPLHRLLFAGLWCHADREGRLEDKPREIRVKVLPFDDCDVDRLLADLDVKGLVVRYEVDGKRLLAVKNFKKHQHCHKDEKPSRLAPPPDVTAKPPQPFEAGVAAMVAPQEHREGTEEALQKPGASPPVICNRVSVSGSPSPVIGGPETGAPAAPAAPLKPAFEWLAQIDQLRSEAFPSSLQDAPESGRFIAWWKQANAQVPPDGLLEAYRVFLRDPWVASLSPPAPWSAWQAQWKRFVPGQSVPAPAVKARRSANGF
jgi:hypothetical protein